MINKKYIGDLVGGSLFVTESRLIADLLLEKPSDAEFKARVIEDNILQKNSGKTGIRYARTVRARLNELDDEFTRQLVTQDGTSYVQMLMVALLVNSPIVIDFMKAKLAEARRTYKPNLEPNVWITFYEDITAVKPDLAELSESTIKKMGNNAIKALVDSGYLSDSRKKQIQPVYLLPEVKECLVRLGRDDLINVMECTV